MFSRIESFLKDTYIFDICVRILIILLPFTTLITVVGKTKIHVPFIGFYKEILLLTMILSLFWSIKQYTIKLKIGIIDWMLGIYVVNLLAVSIFTTGIPGIVYGGRYDFAFLIIFWTLYHGSQLLKENFAYYLKLFLVSTGAMIFMSALLKYPLSEDLLLYLGYSGNPSVWEFSGVPPIFHGIDGANVRRFQGILDGPNTMGAFLIFFTGIFTYYFRGFKSWYFVNGGIILVLLTLILYTYSRSATLGILCAIGIAIIGSISIIFKQYKKEMITLGMIGLFLMGIVYIQYSDRIGAIIGRAGSTQGHLERMMVGVERVKSAPLGQGLGSAGPGYRYVQDIVHLDQKTREEMDRFYIPESWYIQQFIEGGIVGGVCFIILMGIMFLRLWKISIFLASMFAGVGVMNLFLHTFESSPFSLLFFSIIGIILGSHAYGKRFTHR